MLSEAHPYVRRALRFAALPYCYFFLINWKDCTKSRIAVIFDLLYIFFRLKYFPDNYSPCQLDKKNKNEWAYYYGSSYHSYARAKLRKEVQPYEYQVIFNDKSVCEYFCRGLAIRMPEYYGVLDQYTDYRKIISDCMAKTGNRKLIIKAVKGHAGRGIDMVFIEGEKIYVKSGSKTVLLDDYTLEGKVIIQEVIMQDDRISKIGGSSVNTIRLVSLLTKENEAKVISSSMRFGVGNSYVDNWSAGGIAVGVDITSGRLMSTAYDKKGNKFKSHPETGFAFHGVAVPYWDEIIEIAIQVQSVCTFYRLIGIDVAISTDGPVLIEVNANPDFVFQEQTAGPFLKNRLILEEFNKYDLLINSFQKELLGNVECSC